MALEKDYVKRALKRFEDLQADASARDNWINIIDHYASPYKYNFKYNQETQNQDLPSDIYETTMIESREVFSAGLHSQLTNPSTEWFKLETENKELMNQPGVRIWFSGLERQVYSILSGSNFYNQVQEGYDDLASGNMILYREEDAKSKVRYTAIPPVNVYWEEDATGRVTSVYRYFKYTAEQMIEKWGGDAVSEKVKKAYSGGKTAKFDIVHIVRPRWKRDVSKTDKLNKQYESLYIERDAKNILSESGYDSFPFFIGRYKKPSGWSYGYGPGNIAIYSTKMANQFMLTMVRRAQKETDPPYSCPSDGFVLPIMNDPGSPNYRISDDPADKIEYYPPGGNAAVAFEIYKVIKEQIRSAFHVDLFLAISDKTKRMTVPEVNEVISEKMPLLGSSLSRLMDEVLSPIVSDLVEYVIKNKLVPEPPEVIRESGYKIEYVSPLARAQKITQARGTQALLSFVGGIAQLDPQSIDNFDFDRIAKSLPDITGSDGAFLRDDTVVQVIRKDRQQQIEETRQKQELLSLAEGVEKGSKADLNSAKAQSA